MPKRPHGLLGLREAEYRVANPGQWRKRRPINTRWEQAVRAWMVVLVSDEVQHQDLSPWDVLLMSVRLAWLRVLEVEDQLNALKPKQRRRHGRPCGTPVPAGVAQGASAGREGEQGSD